MSMYVLQIFLLKLGMTDQTDVSSALSAEAQANSATRPASPITTMHMIAGGRS